MQSRFPLRTLLHLVKYSGVRHLRALGAVSSSPIRPSEWAALTGQEASSGTSFAQASRCFQLRDDLLGFINSSRRQTRRNDGDERRRQIVARRGLEAIYLRSSVRCCVREMDSLVAGKSNLYAGTRLVSSRCRSLMISRRLFFGSRHRILGSAS